MHVLSMRSEGKKGPIQPRNCPPRTGLITVQVIVFDGRILDRAVHLLDLSACPEIADLSEAVLNVVLSAGMPNICVT